jgi:tetratricopeptide (TPR) repeat protein
LFVITLARPELLEKRPTWGAGHRNFTSLYLEPLSELAMEDLLIGLVPGLPPSLRSQILARAEGVPLYAVETVRMLLDRGLLVEEGSAYKVVGEVEKLEVPETLHALIAARLDGLSPDERRLLGDAAVLGKTFTPQALAALSGLEGERLDGLLSSMVRREVLGLQSDPRSPEQGQYTFLQDLLRHVAYETLPKRERREKHLAAAEHLAASLDEDEVAEVIASHMLDAYRLDAEAPDAEALRSKAHMALLHAAERAAALGAPSGALRYYELAAELASTPAEQAAAMSRAGEAAATAGDPERARSLFGQAIGLYSSGGDTHASARASSWLALTEFQLGNAERAIEGMEAAYAVVGDDEPDADLAYLILRLGQAHFFGGNPERASDLIERGLDLAEALRLTELLALGWTVKATLISPRRPEEARGLFQLALDTSLANELYQRASVAGGNLSDLSFRVDRYADSLARLEQALVLARRIGDRALEWYDLAEMTYALTMLGRWDEALARFAELPDEQLGALTDLSGLLSSVVELHLHRGQLDEARKLLARFEKLARTSDLQTASIYQVGVAAVRHAEGDHRGALTAAEHAFATRDALGVAGQSAKLGFLHALEAAAVLGDEAKSRELLEVVESLSPGLRPPLLEAVAHRFRARLAGDDPGADRHFRTATVQLRALELPFYLAVVQLEYGEWLMARGRPDDAQPLVAEARDTFERLEAAPWLERLDAVSSGASAEIVA